MRRRFLLVLVLVLVCAGFWATPAAASERVIVRTFSLSQLQQFCSGFLFQQNCTVVSPLGDPSNQLFLVTTPLDLNVFLSLLSSVPGVLDAEVDQLISLVGGLNVVKTPPAGLFDQAPINYVGTTVWNGYANQPAAYIVRVQDAQNAFQTTGSGIVADIDTGVDPNHPALQPVLLPGYDFTRNQPGGSEMTDFTGPPPSGSTSNAAQVNQSSAAILDQSSAAILDSDPQYAAFGHGTMVLGIVHLVAPSAQLLPLKAFRSDGTGFLSDILRAVYYAVQNKADIINMSFDFTTSSQEFFRAMTYTRQNGVVCVASAGNNGVEEIVYAAAWQKQVMGVASTSDTDTRSSFSDFGNSIVWVAAPGEAVITTYPFSTYAAGWGTSFSAPFVSGGVALLQGITGNMNQPKAEAAVAYAVPLGYGMGNGRLDLVQALQSLSH